MAIQGLIGGGLIGVDIQAGGADLAGLQGGQQSSLVHIGAARGIDDHHAVLHLGDILGGNQSAAIHSGSVDGNKVGLGQQIIHLHIGDAQLLLDAGDVEDVERHDLHADGFGHHAQVLTDAAEAHDAQGLALQLDALAVSLLLPLVLTHGVAGDGEITGAGEHMAHGQLGYGLGGGTGGVLHGDTAGLGVLDIDIVNAHAAADDELELAGLGLVNMVGADLGLGADHHGVKILQGGAQLVGLIELLDDLVTHLAELSHGGLIHTVGNQNTHNCNLLIIYFGLGAGKNPPVGFNHSPFRQGTFLRGTDCRSQCAHRLHNDTL